MELSIRNIGAIGDVSVRIDGITVIAGENSSGKSTVGKTLFSLLHGMSAWQPLYHEKCTALLRSTLEKNSVVLEDYCMKTSGAIRRRTSRVEAMLQEFVSNPDFLVAVEDFQFEAAEPCEGKNKDNSAEELLRRFLVGYCERYAALYIKDDEIIKGTEAESIFTKWAEDVADQIRLIEMDETKLQCRAIMESFSDTFHAQYRRIGSEESLVTFTDDSERSVNLRLSAQEALLSSPIRVSDNIFFLESPKVYDLISKPEYGGQQTEILRQLMIPNIFKRKFVRFQPLKDKVEINSGAYEADSVLKELQLTMGGKSEFYQKVGLEFKDDKISEPIHSDNVSSGLKSLALLEYALRIQSILPQDILILDEPEINLHPSWQVAYAKALVSLKKQYRLRLIITSHSPFFIRAIEVFSDLEGEMDNLNVYLMSRDEKNIVGTENVSFSEYGVTELYNRLSEPIEKLEDLLNDKYGE